MSWVICSPGRTATTWIAEKSTLLGTPCVHEKLVPDWGDNFVPNVRQGLLEVSHADWAAAPVASELTAQGHRVAGVYRPWRSWLQSIRTKWGDGSAPWTEYARHHSGATSRYPIDAAVEYWIGWYEMLVESDAVLFSRPEYLLMDMTGCSTTDALEHSRDRVNASTSILTTPWAATADTSFRADRFSLYLESKLLV